MKRQELLKELVTIPDDYQLIDERNEIRNKQEVTIWRFQKDGRYELNGPRIIAVFLKDTLISVKNMSTIPSGKMSSPDRAREIAETIFAKSNRSYARGLSFFEWSANNANF